MHYIKAKEQSSRFLNNIRQFLLTITCFDFTERRIALIFFCIVLKNSALVNAIKRKY